MIDVCVRVRNQRFGRSLWWMPVAAFWKFRFEVMVDRGGRNVAFVEVLRQGLGSRMCKPHGLSLQPLEHLVEQGWLRPAFALRRDLAVLELVLGITYATARLFDVVFDHRHHGVISYTALARTVVVHDVAGPEPALLHALPRNTEVVRSLCGRENGHGLRVPSAILARTSSSDETLDERSP